MGAVAHFRDAWSRRELLRQLTWRDIKAEREGARPPMGEARCCSAQRRRLRRVQAGFGVAARRLRMRRHGLAEQPEGMRALLPGQTHAHRAVPAEGAAR